MASTIKLKNGSGAPTAGDLVQGEPALDLTNKRLYTEDAGGNVIEIGTSPSTIDINAGTIDGTVIGGASAAAGTFTTLTATGNVVLGDAATDTVTVTADVASDLIPSADGTYDLGASGSEWQDLFIDGTANIDSLVADTADINGGTIDGVTIGGASAGAGTFTTLTTGSTVTLNGGTANGVLYLNGSKVATSGSALTFDGTNFFGGTNTYVTGRFYAQRSSSSLNLPIAGYTDGSAGAVLTGAKGDIVAFGNAGGDGVIFANGNTEQMRLTSTGLGIGTTSPTVKLDVTGSGRFNVLGEALTVGASTLASYTAQYFRNTSSFGVLALTSGSNQYLNGTVAGDFVFGSNGKSLQFGNIATGVLQATITSAGNVGIGTTSPAKTLDVNGEMQADIYRYPNANVGGIFDISGSNGIEFYGSTNAGADKLIAYTGGSEAMRIDSSGNLLVGGTATPTSSAKNIVLYNGTAPTGNATDGVILYAEDVSASSELKVRDEAGNVTTLSPHNFDLIPEGPSEDMAWSYYSERDGKRINVDMLKAIRLLEQLTGEKLVHTN